MQWQHVITWRSLLLLATVTAALPCLAAEDTLSRHRISLDGEWQFRRDGSSSNAWKSVRLPASFQSHEGPEWHGVGWYRKRIESDTLPAGERLFLEFTASATETEAWWNGQRLGSHLGGWTPFRFEIPLSGRAPGKHHELVVRVDEKVGHNTQGFLPVIAPHFGGIWQSVALLAVPAMHLDDLHILAVGEPAAGRGGTPELLLEVPLIFGRTTERPNLRIRYRLRGTEAWSDARSEWAWDGNVARARSPVPGARLWSPADPSLYEVEVATEASNADVVRTRAGFRRAEAYGPQIRLNGAAVQIRGLLNWGYSPPSVDPNPGEKAWRRELEFARSCGFNLMKFCLWIPPKRYLELADEMGMLTWMEYPTWHPTLTARFREPLLREFKEFFAYDRNHPSVMLRSLTCETGPSAELPVIQELYDTAHAMIPGALVEDDSSWIGWNRIHDFYDDHPYGNNHTWVNTLAGFKEHILSHGLKPLVLGECMAADTWPDHQQLMAELDTNRPWHAPGVLEDLPRWESRMATIAGPAGIETLGRDSLRYAMLMRKYQAETFRREIPYGGYVISVIRDIPNASMGLLDYRGASKWPASGWAWQGDTMLLLQTPRDRRAFTAGKPLEADVLLSHFGTVISNAAVEIRLLAEDGRQLRHTRIASVTAKAGTVVTVARLPWDAPDDAQPTRYLLEAKFSAANLHLTNSWPIWIVPAGPPGPAQSVRFHSSVSPEMRAQLCPGGEPHSDPEAVIVASRFDPELARMLESGARVLLLPDGKRHSFPLSPHWFLRGAPFIPQPAVPGNAPRDFLLELQHFDLASDVVPNLPHLEAIQPWLLLWDTHDQKTTVQTHGLIFETTAGRGRLLVSAVNHATPDNPAGQWLLQQLIQYLAESQPPAKALPMEVWDYLKQRLTAEQTDLTTIRWSFRPDPNDEGLANKWHLPETVEDGSWKPIRIGAWWESQGYPGLDRWAWYRLAVEVPAGWEGRKIYLSFEGVDDLYELYVNGVQVGKGGDLASKRDALQEKVSHDITSQIRFGQKVLLAVRVHDWYGAGGIFRPVILGTLPLRPELDLLK